MLLCELYQEYGRSTFTYDGEEYDLNKLLRRTEDYDVEDVKVSDLKWILEYDKPDPERVKKADLSCPILVTKWKSKLVAVDGLHRTAKAVKEEKETLPAIFVTKADLEKVKL